MRKRIAITQTLIALTLTVLLGLPVYAQKGLENPRSHESHRTEMLQQEVRHELVTLPYYSVFDWLEYSVKPDGSVTLTGEVTSPTLKDDARTRVARLEGVTQLTDNVEVLPVSTNDGLLRVALYRAIFNYNSPLFRYATQSVPPIHIMVKNGHAALKGVVASEMDKQLAFTAANQVPGVFEVQNELQVESRATE